MDKKKFISVYAEKLDVSKKEAERSYEAFVDTCVEGIEQDGELDLTKFMKVTRKLTNARKGRNPQSGEEIDIPAGEKLAFKGLKRLNDIVGK